jgi:hypothetical protein
MFRSRTFRFLFLLISLPLATFVLCAFVYAAFLILLFAHILGLRGAVPSVSPALAAVWAVLLGGVIAGWFAALVLALSNEPRSFAVPVLASALLGGILVLALPSLRATLESFGSGVFVSVAHSLQ